MVAAAAYIATCIVVAVVFETSIRRWIEVPGATRSRM